MTAWAPPKDRDPATAWALLVPRRWPGQSLAQGSPGSVSARVPVLDQEVGSPLEAVSPGNGNLSPASETRWDGLAAEGFLAGTPSPATRSNRCRVARRKPGGSLPPCVLIDRVSGVGNSGGVEFCRGAPQNLAVETQKHDHKCQLRKIDLDQIP